MIRRGFTLLELLLAMALFAAIAAIALPIAGGLLADRELVRGGDLLRAEIIRLRVRAMRDGRTYVMQATAGSNLVTVAPLSSGSDSTEALDQTGSGSALLTGADQTIAGVAMDSVGLQKDNIELPEGITVGAIATSPVGGVEAATVNGSTPVGSGMATTGIPMAATAGMTIDPNGSSMPPIYFYPTGRTSNAVITVINSGDGTDLEVDQSGPSRRITLRGLTGDTMILEDDE